MRQVNGSSQLDMPTENREESSKCDDVREFGPGSDESNLYRSRPRTQVRRSTQLPRITRQRRKLAELPSSQRLAYHTSGSKAKPGTARPIGPLCGKATRSDSVVGMHNFGLLFRGGFVDLLSRKER